MIEVKNLTKLYNGKAAVDDISFTINEGEILGFLGPNGAGKTTTMNIITGYLSATSGTAKVAGFDVLENPIEVKRRIGFLPEQPPLYLDMTVRDYLSFIYDLKGTKIKKKPHLQEICGLVKIEDVYERLIKNLSKGYRQRVGLAQALIGNPDVLVLDEPTVGLDPKQIIEIRTLIKKLSKKHTVILSSHILTEIQAVCERIIVLNRGKIAADGTTEELSHILTGDNKITARIAGSASDVLRNVKDLEGIKSVISLGPKESGTTDFLIETKENVDIRKPLFHLLSEKNWPLMGLKTSELSLEEIFLKITDDKLPQNLLMHNEKNEKNEKIVDEDEFPEFEEVKDEEGEK
jgi:ABC-2 type transport system ATP-binding protein